MNETFSDLLIKYLMQKGYAPKDKVLFKYGFNIFIRYFFLTIIVSMLILIIGDAQYILLFDFIVIIMRFHCGGYHLESAVNCFFVSVAILSIIPKIVLEINMKDFYTISLLFVCILFLYFSKSKINDKKVIRYDLLKKIEKRKRLLLVFLSIVSILFAFIDIKYTQMSTYAFLFVSLVVLIDKLRKNGGEDDGKIIWNV